MPANHLSSVCYLVFKDQGRTFSSTELAAEENSIETCLGCQAILSAFSSPPRFTHQSVSGLLSTGSAVITDRRWPCQVSFPHSFPWKGKARPASNEAGLLEKFRRRPTFPHSYPCSIIGAVGLNFCVRNGNRCDSYAIATENRTTGFQLPKT